MNLEIEAYEGELRELRKALAQPEQEPVAWVYNGILHEFDPSEFATSEVKPLYTAPQKREWVGLTEVDIYELMDFDNYVIAITLIVSHAPTLPTTTIYNKRFLFRLR